MTKKSNMTLEKRIKALVATNSMKSRESFFKRLAYKIYAYQDSDGEDVGVVKDFTQFENILYGRVDTLYNCIELQPGRLVPIKGSQNQYALRYVADAYAQFSNEIKTAVANGKIRNAPFFQEMIVKHSYLPIRNAHRALLNTAGALPAGTYDVKVLSPDLRQDDKPRLDKTLVLPSTAIVYRTAVSAPGVKANAASDTIKIVAMGANAPGNTGSEITLTAASTKFYPTAGSVSAMNSIPDGTALGSATTVQVITSAANTPELETGQGAGRNAPSAIIVEVCYYIPAAGPDADDTHIPYAIEAGQGT